MDTSRSTDVIVVGGGPVGLFLALRLAQLNVRVLVLEALHELVNTPKAIAYQPFVLPEFSDAGVLDDLREKSATKYDKGSMLFRTPADEEKSIFYQVRPPPGKTLPSLKVSQYEVCQVLFKHLARYQHVEVLMGHRVVQFEESENGVKICAQPITEPGNEDVRPHQKTFEASYLVGADGGRSTIRKLSGIKFHGETLGPTLVAADVRYPFENFGAEGVNFFIDPKYWGVYSPIDDHGLWRVSFGFSTPQDDSRPIDEHEIRAKIPEYFNAMFPGPRPLEYEVKNVAGYHAHQLYAETFRKGRVLLCGDAAHLTNPYMALGLISGIFDASSLARALDAMIHKSADMKLLDSWAKARLRVYKTIVDPMSRSALAAAQMDAFNDSQEVIAKHPVIQRFEAMKKGGIHAQPPLSTDVASLDGWPDRDEVPKSGESKLQAQSLPYYNVLKGVKSSLTTMLGFLSSQH